jgi:hypothetical protein
MGNGLKVARFFSSNGSKVTALLFKSNLPTTACTVCMPGSGRKKRRRKCCHNLDEEHSANKVRGPAGKFLRFLYNIHVYIIVKKVCWPSVCETPKKNLCSNFVRSPDVLNILIQMLTAGTFLSELDSMLSSLKCTHRRSPLLECAALRTGHDVHVLCDLYWACRNQIAEILPRNYQWTLIHNANIKQQRVLI